MTLYLPKIRPCWSECFLAGEDDPGSSGLGVEVSRWPALSVIAR
jgi:hypothetical protein